MSGIGNKMPEAIVSEARHLAGICHRNQYRHNGVTPYITHPEAVAEILEKEGVKDDGLIATAWLHDTVEDSELTLKDVEGTFGKTIAERIHILTRDVGREEYKQRLLEADAETQKVKLADVLHNVSGIGELPAPGYVRKVRDCEQFYIPLAMKIWPSIGEEMKRRIEGYKSRIKVDVYAEKYDKYMG